MTLQFGYDKKQVLVALRYHFLSKPEIKTLLVVVNVFAIVSAVLFAMKMIQPFSFLIFSLLWFLLMLVIWRLLPAAIYKREKTFQDQFTMQIEEQGVELSNPSGSRAWPWSAFSTYLESPYFFHLYFDSRSFFLIPKDALADINTLQAVRDLIKQKIRK